MTPEVVGVRQNLSLLVDAGRVMAGPGDGSGAQADPAPRKLWDVTQSAERCFRPSDRDFVSVYIR